MKISDILKRIQCAIQVYMCNKYDANPIQCVKEEKCKVPKAWEKEYYKDKVDKK